MTTSTPTESVYQWFVGVDIAAETATAVWQTREGKPSRALTFAQTPEGMNRFQSAVQTAHPTPAEVLVVMEATGSYWMVLACTLHTAGYAVAVINPAQAHAFAKALLKRNKTDPIDAATLAKLAALLQPARWSPPPAVYHELVQRLAQRDDLMLVAQQFKNQLHALQHQYHHVASVQERLERLIATLTKEIAILEAEITPTIAQEDAWEAAATRLQTIPGVGLITSAWILALTLNFTQCATADAAAAYAGLVPREHRSGTSVHKRATIGHTGNRRLRTALYLATLSGAQHNPILKEMYERLKAAGKPTKVARCAVARKLIRIAWAVVTKGEEFTAEPPQHGRREAT